LRLSASGCSLTLFEIFVVIVSYAALILPICTASLCMIVTSQIKLNYLLNLLKKAELEETGYLKKSGFFGINLVI
jgi:hypothetical protein